MHGRETVIPVKKARDGLEGIFHTRGLTGMKEGPNGQHRTTDIRRTGRNLRLQTEQHHQAMGGVHSDGRGSYSGDQIINTVRPPGPHGGKDASLRAGRRPAGRRHAGSAGKSTARIRKAGIIAVAVAAACIPAIAKYCGESPRRASQTHNLAVAGSTPAPASFPLVSRSPSGGEKVRTEQPAHLPACRQADRQAQSSLGGGLSTPYPVQTAQSDEITPRWPGKGEAPPDFARRRQSPPATHIVQMIVTAYCPCEKCCGRWADGITASGKPVSANKGRFVAAPAGIPFFNQISIPGYAGGLPVPVLDRGGAINGDRLDVFFPTHAEALAWGRQTLMVAIQPGRRDAENAEVKR